MKHEQLTAWALNELSPEEKAQLEAALHDDAAAQQQAAETRAFCGFLSTHLFDANIALAEEQRAALQKAAAVSTGEKMNSTPVKTAASPAGKRAWWRQPLMRGLAAAAALAIIATGAWLLLQDRGQPLAQAQPLLALNDDSRSTAADAREKHLMEIPKDGAALPTIQLESGNLMLTQPVDLTVLAGPLGPVPPGQPVSPDRLIAQSAPETQWAAISSTDPLAIAPPGTGTLDYSELDLTTDLTRQSALGNFPQSPPAIEGRVLASTSETSAAGTIHTIAAPKRNTGSRPLTRSDSGTVTLSGVNSATPSGADSYTGATSINGGMSGSGSITSSGGAVVSRGAVFDGTGKAVGTVVMNPIPAATAAAAPAAPSAGQAAAAATPAPTLAVAPAPAKKAEAETLSATVAEGKDNRYYFQKTVGDVIPPAQSFPQPPKSRAPTAPSEPGVPHLQEIPHLGRLFRTENAPQPNNESYTPIVENVLQDVTRAPLSTFSIDVDTASYANVRRFLNQNTAPPPDAVRIEELINYFPTNAEGPAPQAKEPFAVGIEMAECPWQPLHRLARINIKGRDLGSERKPSNLVFLVDVSGSMNSPAKLPLVQQSLRMLAERLGEEDSVSMVVYAGSSGLVLPTTNGMKKAEILGAIDRLQAGGSTHGSAGIQLAYQQAVSGFIKSGVNRVILCTDGDFNVGVSSPEELEKLITEKARSGVFLSVLGYGAGNLKDRTMETLADKGNGNYAYIDSLSEARKVLVEQMGGTLVTIAKDVKIQVEFNPRVIRSYRLIGYENRLLAKEDFNDDTKDAGEIGAGHSVTALYELVPANLPPGADPRPMVDDLKYQPRPDPALAATAAAAAPGAPAEALPENLTKEALTVKLRYKEPEGSTSQLIEVPVNDDAKRIDAAGPEFKFSAAVAGFGLLLRHSSYAGDLTWDKVRDLAQQGKGTDKEGYRGEFLQLIEKARGVSGR